MGVIGQLRNLRKRKKILSVYNVDMSSFEEMLFSKYIQIKGIAMNTISSIEREQIASSWLKNNKKLQGSLSLNEIKIKEV